MVRNRYAMMKRSSCEHDKTVARAVDIIRKKGNNLGSEVESFAATVMGCLSLGNPSEWYAPAAQRIIDYAAQN